MELLSAGVQPSAIPATMYASASAFLDSMEGNSVPSVPYCSYENRQPLRPPTIKKGVRLERLCWYNYTEPDAEGDEGGSMWRSLARQNTSLPSALPCSLASHRLLPLGRCSCTVIETENVRKGPRSFYKSGEAVLVRWCAAPPHETSQAISHRQVTSPCFPAVTQGRQRPREPARGGERERLRAQAEPMERERGGRLAARPRRAQPPERLRRAVPAPPHALPHRTTPCPPPLTLAAGVRRRCALAASKIYH